MVNVKLSLVKSVLEQEKREGYEGAPISVEPTLPLEGGFLDVFAQVASNAFLQAALSPTIPSKALLPAFFNCCTYLAKPKLEFGTAVEILNRFCLDK